MTKLAAFATAFALLSTGCAHQKAAIPDPTVPHRLAEEAEVTIWVCVQPPESGRCPAYSKVKVRVLPGWWVAGPPAVE